MTFLHAAHARAGPPTLTGEQCPAKSTVEGTPGVSVLDHCRIVGSVAGELVHELPARVHALLPDGSVSLVALHDIGKASPGFLKKHFQHWLTSVCEGLAAEPAHLFEDKHAIVSEAALGSWSAENGYDANWQRWAQVVGAHHGTRSQPLAEPTGRYGGKAWQAVRHELIQQVLDECGLLPSVAPTGVSLQLATGLTCVADWVGSNEIWFDPGKQTDIARLPQRARAAVEAAGFRRPPVRIGLGFGDLFPKFKANEIQEGLAELATTPGVYIVEAPMGMGKTEAALYAAYRLISAGQAQGLYFALPTRLTSNRVHERIGPFLRRAFGDEAIAQLVHGHAWLTEHAPGGEELAPGGAWFAPTKRALLAPFGVGTVDQALLSVLNVRHAFVRTFGLAGKVVILDEVHAYDAYTGALIDALVGWLRQLECTVIVLSATLTARRRAELLGEESTDGDAYPLLSARRTGYRPSTRKAKPPGSKRIRCNYHADEVDELAAMAADRAASGQQVLWINNTVARSQAAFRSARGAVREGIPVGLLHSRFPAWRREQLEDEWLARLGKQGVRDVGSILVATQIVEQSVDVDADFMITDLAPTDMLLQRLGRLWRHERSGRAGAPECVIAGEELHAATSADRCKELCGASRWIYAPYVLWRTYRLWDLRSEVVIPDEIRGLLEATYRDADPEDLPWVAELHAEVVARRERLAGMALGRTRADLPTAEDSDDLAPTRWSDRPTIQVLLTREVDTLGSRARLLLADAQSVDVSSNWRSVRAARALHRNMVSLPVFPDFGRAGGAPEYLRATVHGPIVVLCADESGRLRTPDNSPTAYAYDDWLGVRRVATEAEEGPEDALEDMYESDW